MHRISIFLPSLRGGGAERSILTLANAFSKRGLSVDLVLAKKEGPFLRDVEPSVRVIDLGASRVLASLPGLVRYIRREHPNAIISALSHANVIAIWARQLAAVPTRLIVTERNTLTRWSEATPLRRARLMPFFMRLSYRKADAVVAVSGGVADDLATAIGFPREHISVIYNPVVTPELIERSGETLHHPWFEFGAAPVILAAGRLNHQKDFATLIRAFAQVRLQRLTRLVILGEGETRNALQTQVSDLGLGQDVLLPGFISNPYPWMRRAAVFVLSSRWEGLPGVLIQAMACGTPVISTDCPSGPIEILAQGKWGRLVPVGNAAALAEAIIATLDEDNHPDVASRAKEFSLEVAVTAYLRILQAGA